MINLAQRINSLYHKELEHVLEETIILIKGFMHGQRKEFIDDLNNVGGNPEEVHAQIGHLIDKWTLRNEE